MVKYPWGHNRRFHAYPEYMKKVFGGRVQKLTIDAGFTCPNRDGTKGTGGCSFCLNDAFNPSYCNPGKSVRQQMEEGIAFHEKRYRRANQFLAYFQAYTNSYAPLTRLKELYTEALELPGVIGIVIGTRPDCMDDLKLDYLEKLAQKVHVVVEYGIESVYNKTLRRVNRCHTFEEAADAIKRTAGRGIHIGGHMIFGLPGESRPDMLKSAGILAGLPLNSLKFHQLQLFSGTVLAEEYHRFPQDFYLFDEHDYLEFMADYISLLPPEFIVERIAGETPPRFSLIRPWGPRYDQILVKFEKLLEEKDIWQGKNFS
jgi:radical SAM protein (TIGR01212 family)